MANFPRGLIVPGVASLGTLSGLFIPGGDGGAEIVVPHLRKLTLDAVWVCEGDSITAGSNGPQYEQWADFFTGGRFARPIGWNQGTGGETAKQMVDEVDAVTATGPDLITFLAGTNDLTSSDQDPPETIFGYIKTCVLAYLTAGTPYVIVSRVLPRFDDTWVNMGNHVQREADRQTLNAMIAALPQDPDIEAQFPGQVKIASSLEGLMSKTVDYIDTGLHPNVSGAIKLGASFANAMTEISDNSVTTDRYLDATNLLLASGADNPALTGTGGVLGLGASTGLLSGVVADGWTVDNNDTEMTAVLSKGLISGVEGQVVLVQGNCAEDGRVINFRNPVTVAAPAGSTFELAIDFRLESGSQGVQNVLCSCSTAEVPQAGDTVRGNFNGQSVLQGTMRAPLISTLTADATSVTPNFQIAFAAGPVSARIVWGRPYLRLL